MIDNPFMFIMCVFFYCRVAFPFHADKLWLTAYTTHRFAIVDKRAGGSIAAARAAVPQ